MAFCELNWGSQVLGSQTVTSVLLPDTGTGPFPVFYLLHGLSDNHSVWMRQTRIEVYAAAYPMIVVMPDGGRGFYTDQHAGPRWATHLAEELPAIIERTFPARTDRGGRCVGGLSMGGYGAMRLALGYPDRYVSANSHSGALMGPNPARFTVTQIEFDQIVGPTFEGSAHDLLVLAKAAQSAGQVPKIRLDCGTEDFLLSDSRTFDRQLTEARIDHEYQEFPGVHNWDYWDEHVRDALAFHHAVMSEAGAAR